MKVTFKTGSEANYGSINGEMFFASDTKQLLLNGIKYIPKKLSELTNDSGFLTSITKSMVEGVLTGNITSHTHNYIPLTDKGLSNGMVPYYVDFPTYSQLVSLGYNEESTSTVDEYYFKGLCKWAIDNYANQGQILLIGNAQPNSVGYCCIQLYSNNGKDANTGLPRYCSGMYNGLKKNILIFGCVEYIWYWEGTFNGNATSASKLATARTIKVGSASKSFDGSSNIEFALGNIITQSDTINVGTLNVAEKLTTDKIEVKNNLTISSGADISGLTPSMIGAAEALHTHSYLPLSGGTMSNTNLVTNLNADLLDGYHASSFYTLKSIRSSQNSIYDLRYNYGTYNKSDHNGTYKDEYPTGYGGYIALAYKDKNIGALMFFDAPTSNVLGHIYVRTRGAGDENTNYSEWGTLAYLTDNVASASKWATPRTITLTGSVTGSVSIDGSANVSLDTTTNHTHSEYLSLSGGTLTGDLTVPKLTSTGGILLGDSSLSAMVGSIGIQRHDETGFIGFLKDFNLDNSFNGVVLGWDGNYSLQENSVRIDASTFTYKGNNVWHSGNLKLGYISSGLSRAVQKDTNGNLFIVAPSLFEQGISNNYPKNLRWSNETEGQLVYDKEIEAGNFDTVEISIPLADGTSKGFLKSTSTVTNVTGYTPCPVVSGTPYYKLDAIELDYTDFLEQGSGSIESNLPLSTSIPNGGSLEYLLNYGVNNIPRLLTIDLGGYWKYFFWLQQTDDESPIVAYYHCQFNDLWLVIDSPNREIRISQGGF